MVPPYYVAEWYVSLRLPCAPPRNWGRLNSIAEEDHMWRCTAPHETQRILLCGGHQTGVGLVLGNRFTGLDPGSPRDMRRVVDLYSVGTVALSMDNSCIESRVYLCGTTFFHFNFHPTIRAKVHILRSPVDHGTVGGEGILPLFVALLMALWWDYSGQTLCFIGGACCQRRCTPQPNFCDYLKEL